MWSILGFKILLPEEYNVLHSACTTKEQQLQNEINKIKLEKQELISLLFENNNKLNEYSNKLLAQSVELDKIKEEYKSLLDSYNKLTEPKTEDAKLEKYWNEKYKKTLIEYSGRSLPYSQETCKIPVNVLITPNDGYIIEDLTKWKLYRTGEDPETLIPKIYKKIKEKYYKYKYDKDVWGQAEVWEFPFEMRAKAEKTGKWQFDCDSYASLLVSYYISAGVPRWRTRVVAGSSWVGGHSTVYSYSLIDGKWHHTNSTYGFKEYDNLHEYPTHNDAKSKDNPDGIDPLGIHKVWFSYNDLYCWQDFKEV